MAGVFVFENIYEDNVSFDPTLPPMFDLYAEEEQFECDIDSSIDFNLPPLFDNYGVGVEETVVAGFQEPCYPIVDGYVIYKISKSTKHTNGAIKFQGQLDNSFIGFHLFEDVVHYGLIRLVHGGWWGGWHKEFLKFKGENKMKSGNKWGAFLYMELLLVLVFDPGGLTLQELRSILF